MTWTESPSSTQYSLFADIESECDNNQDENTEQYSEYDHQKQGALCPSGGSEQLLREPHRHRHRRLKHRGIYRQSAVRVLTPHRHRHRRLKHRRIYRQPVVRVLTPHRHRHRRLKHRGIYRQSVVRVLTPHRHRHRRLKHRGIYRQSAVRVLTQRLR